jgi:hypothetical protein
VSATAEDALPRPTLDGLLPFYVLIDPLVGDYYDNDRDLSQCAGFPGLRLARSEAWGGRDIFLAEGDEPLVDAHLLPYLVPLDATDDALLDELIRAAVDEHRAALDGAPIQRYCVGALIETWMAPTDLMRRLQKMWTYPRPNTDNFTYLRFSERRVFEALMHRFEPAALARWLGPIARWHFLGRDFRWHTVDGEPERWYVDAGLGLRRTVDSARALEGAALHVGPRQHLFLRDLAAHARALADWQRAGRSVDAKAHELAWAGIDEALRQGLTRQPDKGAFAACWMRDPACAERDAIREALARSRAQGLPFAEALAEVEPPTSEEPHSRMPS